MPLVSRPIHPRLPLELIMDIINWALVLGNGPLDRQKTLSSLTLVNKRIGMEAWRRMLIPDRSLDLRRRNHSSITTHLKIFNNKEWLVGATQRVHLEINNPEAIYKLVPKVLRRFQRLKELDIRVGWKQEAEEWYRPEGASPFTTRRSAYTSSVHTLKLNNVWPFKFAALIMAGIQNTDENKLESLSLMGGIWHGLEEHTERTHKMASFFSNHAKVFTNLKRLELGPGCDALIVAISRVQATVFPSLQSIIFAPQSLQAVIACRTLLESYKAQLIDVQWVASPFRCRKEEDESEEQKLLTEFLERSQGLLSTIPGLASARLPLVIPDERSSREDYPTASTLTSLLLGAGPSNKLEVIELDLFFVQDMFFDLESCPHHHRGEVLNYFFVTCDQDHREHQAAIPLHDLCRKHLQDATAFPLLKKIIIRIRVPNCGDVPSGSEFTLDDEDFIVNPAGRLEELESSGLVNVARMTESLRRRPTLWDVNFREELKEAVKEHVVGKPRDGVSVDVLVEGHGPYGKPRFG